ncbi:MAG: asparagine synthase-related protein, partial [Pseudomonadota bacterium]
MTLLAGAWSLDAAGSAPDAAGVSALHAALARSGDTVESAAVGRLAVAKIDIGALGSPAFVDDGKGHVLLATGRPLFDAAGRTPHRTRNEDLVALRPALAADGPAALRRCQGSYTLCASDGEQLLLATDKLGARPLYFAVAGNTLWFANAIRLLEAVPAIELSLDVRGLTEEVLLGFALADRTAFAPLRVLRGGEALTATSSRWDRQRYAHWSEAASAPTPARAELVANYHDTFLDAVACRAPADDGVNAFLSGGLDARVIAASLIAAGRPVRTLTFEFPGRLDGPLARTLAAALGTEHRPVPADPGVGQLQHKLTAARYLDPAAPQGTAASIFSGDGGSVGLGYVYMTEAMVTELRDGRRDAALARHLDGKALPRKVLQRQAFERMQPLLRDGIEAELVAVNCDDPARAFHTYLMDNDQRRHLYAVFEQLDIGRTEFELPFFDGRLLEMTAAAPVE